MQKCERTVNISEKWKEIEALQEKHNAFNVHKKVKKITNYAWKHQA